MSDVSTEMSPERIKVAVSDIDGILRGKFIHRDKFASILEKGFGFCSVVFGWDCNDTCYDNNKLSGWHNGYPDAIAKVDPSSKRVMPWENNTHLYLADFVDQHGQPLYACPRQVLKKQIAKAQGLGYSAMFGLEFEWFNFIENSHSVKEKNFANLQSFTPGMFGYSLLRSQQNPQFFHDLLEALEKFDAPIEGLHTETGPGVLEAALVASDALTAADRGVLFKMAVKEVAHRHNLMATFMAKWSSTLPGSSGHMHQSLWTKDGHRNVFYDQARPHQMSQLFEHYLAGQLTLMPELLPFYAPNVNSYKRLVEGFWAPTLATWGIDNRTCALRVISAGPKSTRLETRVSGADINAYLAVAAALGSGLYGIEKKLSLKQAPVVGNAYQDQDALPLPRTLIDATIKLERSEAAREIFGADFIEHLVATRQWEARQYHQAVTDFELKRYFEII